KRAGRASGSACSPGRAHSKPWPRHRRGRHRVRCRLGSTSQSLGAGRWPHPGRWLALLLLPNRDAQNEIPLIPGFASRGKSRVKQRVKIALTGAISGKMGITRRPGGHDAGATPRYVKLMTTKATRGRPAQVGQIGQAFETLSVETRGPGLSDQTSAVRAWLDRIGAGDGLLTLFIRHTSASLLIQENA